MVCFVEIWSYMKITEEQVVEFQKIYLEVFVKPINLESARQQATKLIRLMEIIYQPKTPGGA